jgi:hypothetical protein
MPYRGGKPDRCQKPVRLMPQRIYNVMGIGLPAGPNLRLDPSLRRDRLNGIDPTPANS